MPTAEIALEKKRRSHRKNAIEKLDYAAVAAALNSGASPNAFLRGRETALGLTVLYSTNFKIPDAGAKAVEIAKLLFAKGAKINSGTLFFAISEGNVALVSLLLDNGASPTAKLEGYLPTELAINYGQSKVYDLLLSRGGIPVDKTAAAQIVFIEAAGNGDVVVMERAIGGGARIDDTGPNKMTALVAAVRSGVYERAKADSILWLLDHGADPNREADGGFQWVAGLPLHIFVAMNKTTLAGILARPEIKVMAEETLARLLKAGAKVSGMDSSGKTPLHVAAKFDNVRAAEVLIREGARVMSRDDSGKTPLDYAESASMIRLLKENGARE